MTKSRKRRGDEPGAATPLPASEAPWRRMNVGRMMFGGARLFEERIFDVIREAGFDEVRFVHLTLVRNMDSDGTRLTDLAARAGMTKQAMGQIADQCEALGLVERRFDRADRRARTIAFTARGRRLLEAAQRGVARAEADMERVIGKRALALVRRALQSYCGGAADAAGEAA